MQELRSYAGGRFALSVDGQFAGFMKKVSGGTTKAEVVTHNMGASNIQKKHIATITHEPLTLEIGMGMSKEMWDWIKVSFDKGVVRKNVELIAADFNYNIISTCELLNSYISEVTFPPLDGSSKDTGYFTITVTPETIKYSKGSGQKLKVDESSRVKRWICSNFRLDLGNLDCSRVAKIDRFSMKQGVVKAAVGRARESVMESGTVEFSNLKVILSMAGANTWFDWFESFVIDGKCADPDELAGSITFLGPDLKEELFSLDLENVGICSLRPLDVEKNSYKGTGLLLFEAILYVERMKLRYEL